MRPLRCPPRRSNSRLGIVTRAAGEGPRGTGIDGQCESAHESDNRATILFAEARRPRPDAANAASAERQARQPPAFLFAATHSGARIATRSGPSPSASQPIPTVWSRFVEELAK